MVLFMLMACSTDDQDLTASQETLQEMGVRHDYVNITGDTGNFCEGIDDRERKWLINKVVINGMFHTGDRIYLTYQRYSGTIEGYDVFAELKGVIMGSTRDAIVAPTDAQRAAMGDNTVQSVKDVHLADNGKWLDVPFTIETMGYGGEHEFSLAVNPDVSPESGYIDCDFYHKGQNVVQGSTLQQGLVSFRLPDSANPARLGKKGIILHYNEGLSEHNTRKTLTIDLPQPTD